MIFLRSLSGEFKNRCLDYNKLEIFGFSLNDNNYCYEILICNDEFKVIININGSDIFSKVMELSTCEEYILVDTDSCGVFVCSIREEYEKVITEFINSCSFIDVFKEKQSRRVISYVKFKYNNELEFLWDSLPRAGVIRNNSNNKWYGIMMIIPKNKFGIDSNEMIEIINLKYGKDMCGEVVNNFNIFGAYHMSKRSWISVLLNDSLSDEELFKLIDRSYEMSFKKN